MPAPAPTGPWLVNQLAEPFRLKLPTVSKHLKVLQRAGLVTQVRRAQWRPCRLEPAPLCEVSEWVERHRRIWAERYGQLDAYLAGLQEEEKNREHEP